MKASDQLIVALDVDTFDEARILADSLSPLVETFKVGSQLFTACGPIAVRYILSQDKNVFLDLKFHDIPNTVANAVSAAVRLSKAVHEALDEEGQRKQIKGALSMLTVHTQGGEMMLKMAVEAAAQTAQNIGAKRPMILGITVLTSEEKRDNIQSLSLQRAALAKDCGLDGVVASSEEASLIRQEFGDELIIVTPGIRPKGSKSDDQKRVTTPKEAIENGSNYLVVGRPIVKSDNPAEAAQMILDEINQIQSQ